MDSEKIKRLCKQAIDKGEPVEDYKFYYDVLSLLKEQEAVKPIPFFTETGEELQNYVICGHCKSIKAIMPKYTKQKYCHECGFPVLWEGR